MPDLVRSFITRTAGQDAMALSFDEDDIVQCVLALAVHELHKSMPAAKRPGLYQDVYKTRYMEEPLYVKLQVSFDDRAVIISFKRDESP